MNFTYPSSVNSKEIRLLKPISVSQNSLRFNLITVRRDLRPSYAAVSYTWGNDEPSEFIYLDDQRFYVRPNLWSCLHYLGRDALRSHTSLLWVDAICIDQSSTAEKNSQVRRMDETYRMAAHVSVWLGLPKIPDHVYIPQELLPVKTVEIDPFDWFDHLEDLANRPYWSRVWVIQEFLLARKIYLYCSNSRMEWGDFQEMLCHQAGIIEHTFDTDFRTPGHATNKAAVKFQALPLVMGRHVDKHPAYLQSLHDLIVSHHRAECGDPRDRIFGLLGLVTIEERRLLGRFFPDYTMTPDHVRIIALAHVVQYNSLDGAPRITVRSNELFLGLGVRSTAEKKRLLLRAKIEVFDYMGDWDAGQAFRVLVEQDEELLWNIHGDEEDEQVVLGRRNKRIFWQAATCISWVVIIVYICWLNGVFELPPA